MAENKSAIDYLRDAYSSNLDAQKANLEQDYNNSIANLNEQKLQSQRQTDANLNRTAVEAQKARNNFAETQNAYGLTSGAQAQARLAQNNTELANMSALRAQQQENDAQIERQRGLLADQYAAAIREAQATNDYKLAEQLYADAKAKENAMTYSSAPAKTPGTSALQQMANQMNLDQRYGTDSKTGKDAVAPYTPSGNPVGNGGSGLMQYIVDSVNARKLR